MVALETLNLIELAMAVLGMLSAIIGAVESPGNGAEKKAQAIARAQAAVADLPLPGWAKAIFGNGTVLGVLVDLLVALANNKGIFPRAVALPVPAANAAAPAPAVTQ